MPTSRVLKKDGLGTISVVLRDGIATVVRDPRSARRVARWIAHRLAAREADALRALGRIDGLPYLIAFDRGVLQRSFIAGEPMHTANPRSREYFARALKLVIALHRRGIAHNDLAKEPNWLCMPDGRPAIVDFQLALISKHRGKVFRALAREDLRHLLKHKQTYLPSGLTARQRALLASPSPLARIWRALVKPVYLLVTRRLLGWPERMGPAERQR
ncbi:MAG TPA: RIO1 family regulatory kinase/ATPase [Gammaproteobacteria bacterium]|nr:RIO1 family regulatory kinase/ATPase [Gammaproteobacteria bacterium]